MDSFDRFIAEHGAVLAGWADDVTVHPFHQALARGERLVVHKGRLCGRQFAADVCTAAAIEAGQPVHFLAPTPEAQEEARQRALALLEARDAARLCARCHAAPVGPYARLCVDCGGEFMADAEQEVDAE